MSALFANVPQDATTLTRQEKSYYVYDAAAAANTIDTPIDIEPVQRFLLALEHPYANQWTFCFCVACTMADLKAQERGYKSQAEEAVAVALGRGIDKEMDNRD